jgi:GT2 family glycosyltransferase
VIPNWNGRHWLATCLGALSAQTIRDFKVILIDNGSTDGSVEYVKESFPVTQVIANRTNVGFAAAVNQGILASQSRYVVLLNNDTEAAPDWLETLVEAAESDGRVGMCASKMLFADRPNVINSTGICVDRAGIAWDRRGGEIDDMRESEPVDVFGPSAGAGLYRRAMLEEIGLFDEDFFAYLEDVDLAWRARRAGWRCLHVPAACVLHHHSATGIEGSPFKSFHLGRNKIWLLVKNYPFKQLWQYALLTLFYDWAAVVYALVRRQDVHALRGRLAALAGLGRMWQKRPSTDAPQRTDLHWLAPLEAPWRVPARYRHIVVGEG